MIKRSAQSFLNLGVCLALLIFVCLGCSDGQIMEYTDEAIKNSPDLQELDKVCKEIPLPEGFQFVKKGGLDDQKITLSYHYYSETDYFKARNFWVNYFSENGWKITKENNSYPKSIEFKNDKYKVVIQNGGMGKRANYGIDCEKLK